MKFSVFATFVTVVWYWTIVLVVTVIVFHFCISLCLYMCVSWEQNNTWAVQLVAAMWDLCGIPNLVSRTHSEIPCQKDKVKEARKVVWLNRGSGGLAEDFAWVVHVKEEGSTGAAEEDTASSGRTTERRSHAASEGDGRAQGAVQHEEDSSPFTKPNPGTGWWHWAFPCRLWVGRKAAGTASEGMGNSAGWFTDWKSHGSLWQPTAAWTEQYPTRT